MFMDAIVAVVDVIIMVDDRSRVSMLMGGAATSQPNGRQIWIETTGTSYHWCQSKWLSTG
jgi:hypothetical protein